MADSQTLRIFRTCLGVTLLGYYLAWLPRWSFVFSGGGMIDRNLVSHHQPSLLFLWDAEIWPWILGVCLFYFLIKFSLGELSRLGFWALFFLQISFHNANPLVIHEPQQIANFLLLSFAFLPLNNGVSPSQGVIRILQFFLGLYYLVAGLKKLPDHQWRSGEALSHYLQWEALGKENLITDFILNSGLDRFLGWGALLFEFSFVFLMWTRFRAPLFIGAVCFHVAIGLCLDVGNFGPIMITWCTLLLSFDAREEMARFFLKVKGRLYRNDAFLNWHQKPPLTRKTS